MADSVTRTVECMDCHEPLEPTVASSVPCPKCGSIYQHHKITVVDTISLRVETEFGLHGKSAETRKGTNRARRHVRERYLTVKASADGVRRRVHRTFDRDLDLYEEVVTEEETGWLVRYLREPVSAHRGRGAAKKETFRDACSWAIASIHPEDRLPSPRPDLGGTDD